MKLSEMNEEQRREYNRESKKRQRDRQRQEKEKLTIPNARDYVMPEPQEKELCQHSHAVAKIVAADLGLEKLSGPDGYIVDAVACVLFGLENNFTQIVYQPNGMLVGGWFPDAAASEAIERVHRFPSLLQSTTFADLYRNFLHEVVKWSKKNEQCSTHEFIQEIQAEIAGEYVLPRLPEPKPQPNKIQEAPSVPSDAEMLEQGRIRLLNQLQTRFRIQDPNVSPDARRFLDGTP